MRKGEISGRVITAPYVAPNGFLSALSYFSYMHFNKEK